MVVDRYTELRKLRPAEFYNLALILDLSENWKKLMSLITTEENNDILRFHSGSIAIIEQASHHERKSAAAILLEEWATMGKKQPTLGLLLDLLLKVQLYRAADYLAQNILKIEAPSRPTSGPAVAIDVEEALSNEIGKQNTRRVLEDSICDHRSPEDIRLSQINYSMGCLDTNEKIDNFYPREEDSGVIQMIYGQSESANLLDRGRSLKNVDTLEEENQNHVHYNFSGDLKNNAQIMDNKKTSKSNNDESKKSDLIEFSACSIVSKSENQSKSQETYVISDLMKFSVSGESIEGNSSEKLAGTRRECEKISTISANNFEVNLPENIIDNDGNMMGMKTPEIVAEEMPSAELPVTLGKLCFPRELMSDELPVCINDRTEFLEGTSDSSPVKSWSNSSKFLSSSSIESTEVSSKSRTSQETVAGNLSVDDWPMLQGN